MNENTETPFDAGEYVRLQVERKETQNIFRQTQAEGDQQGYLSPKSREPQI
jgi:hypothetical protein